MEWKYSGNCPECDDLIKITKGKDVPLDEDTQLTCPNDWTDFPYTNVEDINES